MKEEESINLKRLIRSRIAVLEEVLHGAATATDLMKHRQEDDEAANLDMTISSAVDSRVEEQTRQELSRLKNNLQWLEGEEAGLCEHCGKEIPFARLKTVPDTRLCVFCAGSERKKQ